MAIPISLTGDNLGKRHQNWNNQVNVAYKKNIPLSAVLDVPECSPIDRLYKIDLAAKYRNVKYFIKTLKDENLLYVSRALKTFWMLDKEFSNIINPVHIEDVLYPEMMTTAVTKMKHWIELHLKDPERCEQFYKYYKDKEFDTGIKFLPNCSKEFIINEVPSIMLKLSPFRLKLLVEKCPEVAKMFYDSLENDEALKKKYSKNLNERKQYFDNLRFLLKVDGEMFLDITEKYFSEHYFKRFSAESTKVIMRNHKQRFDNKPELYTTKLLDIKTLAKCLSQEEIKEVILKLARAKFLEHWFSYKNVEPLIKSLNEKERAAFKKRIFVEKSVGEKVESWPYEIPDLLNIQHTGPSVFEDQKHDPDEYLNLQEESLRTGFKKKLKKRKYGRYLCGMDMPLSMRFGKSSSLDQLFDRFRFVGFDKALFDLRKELGGASTQRRQYIMLVLVSKSNGRNEAVEQILKLLTTRHLNEPENLRATVIRSLVKRSNAWRLPQSTWDMILEFGRGVGMDGKPSYVACSEGLHASVIRSIILGEEINDTLWEAYLKDFSLLNEYSLNSKEKEIIVTKLPKLLIVYAENHPDNTIDVLEKALNVLDAYKAKADMYSELISAIGSTAKKDKAAESLLRRLYDARLARKELFAVNFEMIQNDESYFNALKHEPTVLATGEKFNKIIESGKVKHDRFLRNLSLYFNEDGGLTHKYLTLLVNYVDESPKKELARPIAILSGKKLLEMLTKYDEAPKKSDAKRFTSALRANASLAIPLIDLDAFGWSKIGAKTVSNRVLLCSRKSIDNNIQKLLVNPRTQRAAFVLAMRAGKEIDVVKQIYEKRPQFILKVVLWHARRNTFKNIDIWDFITPIISKLDESKKLNTRIKDQLKKIEIVPDEKRPEYGIVVYEVFQTVSKYEPMPLLCHIEKMLPKVNVVFIETIIKKFLDEEFKLEILEDSNYSFDICANMRLRILAKYLLLCENEEELNRRWNELGERFFDHLEKWKESNKEEELWPYIDEFIKALKYSTVFLDTKYVDCLPMLEKIVNRLQKLFPVYEYYNIYINMHLNMLYYKSVRQSIKHNPDIFEDLPKNLDKAAEIVGRVFGKYAGREVINLMATQYDSIRYIYMCDLDEYLWKNFLNGDTREIFITNVAKGILDCEDSRVHLLAERIFNKEINGYRKELRDDALKMLEERGSLEIKMFLSGYLTETDKPVAVPLLRNAVSPMDISPVSKSAEKNA